MRSVWIGCDPREATAHAVCRLSLCRRMSQPIFITSLVLEDLRQRGLYTRPTEQRAGRLWDVISGAPMATEFAISRFLVPALARRHDPSGWALFIDCDMLVRTDLAELFALADDRYAVMCVQHDHRPDNTVKMDGQTQTAYPRKNWSSLMLFNLRHRALDALTIDYVNSARGLDLHALTWLDDAAIGALPTEWNWLVGISDSSMDPKIVHFTNGTPDMPGYETAPYADEWRAEHRGGRS